MRELLGCVCVLDLFAQTAGVTDAARGMTGLVLHGERTHSTADVRHARFEAAPVYVSAVAVPAHRWSER